MPTVYLNKMYTDNDIDKLTKVLSVFSMVKNGNIPEENKRVHLRGQAVKVLAYYMLFGYSAETRELLVDNGFSKTNVHQINSELRKLGYLKKDQMNYHNGFLSDELLRIRDYFMATTKDKKLFVIEIL